MTTIENYNENIPMMAQLKDYEVRGYKFADLTAEDKEFVKGIALAIDSVESHLFFLNTGYDIFDTLVEEIERKTAEKLKFGLLSLIDEVMFSCIDGYEEEGE